MADFKGVPCDPRCVDVPYEQVYAELRRDDDPAEMPEKFKGLYVVDHHDACPMLARAIQWGRKVATERGWV